MAVKLNEQELEIFNKWNAENRIYDSVETFEKHLERAESIDEGFERVQNSLIAVGLYCGIESQLYFEREEKAEKKCEDCSKRRTMDCPNSSECYSLDNKPYFVDKEERDVFLKENEPTYNLFLQLIVMFVLGAFFALSIYIIYDSVEFVGF